MNACREELGRHKDEKYLSELEVCGWIRTFHYRGDIRKAIPYIVKENEGQKVGKSLKSTRLSTAATNLEKARSLVASKAVAKKMAAVHEVVSHEADEVWRTKWMDSTTFYFIFESTKTVIKINLRTGKQ